jgi:hypothetical protein
MKIKDTRCGRVFEGTLVAMLQPNVEPSDDDVKKYYRCIPGDKHYNVVKRAQPLPRMVLQRGEPDDYSFYILPRYDFYVEVREEVES